MSSRPVLLVQTGSAAAAEEWASLLAPLLPGVEVRWWDEPGDVARVRYAMVWKPEPGRLASLPALRLILGTGAGVDGVLADPLRPRHVPLARIVTREAVTKMVEYVLLAVLAHHRAWAVFGCWKAERRFTYLDCPPAGERRVGVMGLGELGLPAARALASVGFDAAGWSRSRRTVEGVECFAGEAEFGPFLARSEILVNLLPLDRSTEGVLCRALFERLPKGAFLVNAARGGHLVEEDLIQALDEGLLAGATLDVFREEPLPADHPFWADRRITITPHVASLARPRARAPVVAQAILAFEEGRPLPFAWDA